MSKFCNKLKISLQGMTKNYQWLANWPKLSIILFWLIAVIFNLYVSPALAAGWSDLGLETGANKYLSNQEKIDNFLKNQKTEIVLENIDDLTKRILYPEYKVVDQRIRQITAYNAGDIYQCSGNPCIAANGENICLALKMGYKRCAANFVPFGTLLEIDGYGQCLVTDRMNSRFAHRVDIAMTLEQKQQAREFGLKTLEVKILALK